MVKPQKLGTNVRMSFGKTREVLEMPNLIEVQKQSYDLFIKEGIRDCLRDISPTTDYSGNLVIEFIDYRIESEPKYSIEECKERDVNYASPFRVTVRLTNKVTGEVKEQEIYMGDFPKMTDSGTFVINGAERVIISQIVRSPGVYYEVNDDKSGKRLLASTVIPYRGAWLEYETDASDVFYVRIDKNRKIPVTILLRAFGLGTNDQIIDLFGEEEKIKATLERDNMPDEAMRNGTTEVEEALKEIYKKLRPGDPPIVESAQILLNNLFFDAKRYDISNVGRYKFNKKLALGRRIAGFALTRPVIDENTGEVLFMAGQKLTREDAEKIEKAGVWSVYVRSEDDDREVRVFSNKMVDASELCKYSNEELGISEKVQRDIFFQILNAVGENDLDELKLEIEKHRDELIPKHITVDDVFATVNYLLALSHGIGSADDIDHLGNRRLRSVGELLLNQLRIGFSRMEKIIKEKMTTQDIDTVTPQSLINIRPIVSAIRDFFGSSPLSQFMDQTNPLSELTHKRRLSALGPGGLSRDRASFEVRDVHYTHYGRMCPIETPEGPNIGLISYLATYARVNGFGFIEAPYRVIDKKNSRVTDNVVYLTADAEDEYTIATANELLDENGCFVKKKAVGRRRDEIVELETNKFDLMDISPKMLVSVATAMIPFLENDDNTRALMGSNMQKQAVPLMITESPIVATGMEYRAAVDSGIVVLCKRGGYVDSVTADEVIVRADNGERDSYKLHKFKRSNQGTCINERPVVSKGQRLEEGDVIADGASTDHGEVALGKNVLIGFMTWEGYNYEDAVLLNERLVREDVYTSIHIEEYYCESRDTKLGPEDITRDIPNVGDDALKNLDSDGVVCIGSEVHAGDILVGKVTPKGETELTAEERLLRAIFGEKAREVRDTSLKLPHGESGIIIDVKTLTRDDCDVLQPGVIKAVRVYVAQKRKISVGDKMAGRHGNKGVISRILPSEDMPFLADGTPLDIVLNPLGVPSRMNIGQVLEVHLGIAAKKLGWKIMTPVFDGANESEIARCLEMAGFSPDGKMTLYDGRTGVAFDNPVTVGYMYFLKLHHLVDDKIHARSTGPYSLVTQQPLGGKAQFGGQRFGEMEVWALEAYGAAYTLQEMLTVKSDDIRGRVKAYEAIVKGQNIPSPGVPAAFKVLVKELQSLGLDVTVKDKFDNDIILKDYGDEECEDEKKYSAENLGENIMDRTDFMFDDEEGVIADDDTDSKDDDELDMSDFFGGSESDDDYSDDEE